MMADAPRIRPYLPGDETAINAGFNRVFEQSRPLDDWHWKYPEQPAGRWIMVATDATGAILTHFAAVPMPMHSPDGELLAGQGTDAYALPEARGSRLYSATVAAFFHDMTGPAGIRLFFGFAGPRNAGLLVRQHGFVDAGQAPLWRRSVPPRRPWLPLGHELREGFDAAAIDRLWARCRSRHAWAGIRDGAWWTRRFTGRPGVDYRHLSAWRAGAPRAWVVSRVVGDRVQVADWLWDGESERAVVLLDREIARQAAAGGAGLQEQWLAGDARLAAVLERRGWSPVPLDAPNHLVLRPGVAGLAIPRRVEEIYLTQGDADLV